MTIDLAENQTLADAGAWIVESGRVNVFAERDDGRRLFLFTREPGEVVQAGGRLIAVAESPSRLRATSQPDADIAELLRSSREASEREDEDELLRRREARARNEWAARRSLGDATGQSGGSVPAPGDPLRVALAVVAEAAGIAFVAVPASAGPVGERLEQVAQLSGVRFRYVRLTGAWWHDDRGPLLAVRADGAPVALLPTPAGYDVVAGGVRRNLAPDEASAINNAVAFFAPLPAGKVGFGTFVRFLVRPFGRDAVELVALIAIATAIGLLLPWASKVVIDRAIPDADLSFLAALMVGLIAVNFGEAAFTVLEGFVILRIRSRAVLRASGAVWDRLLRLPMAFFRRFSAGDLLNRARQVDETSRAISGPLVRSLLTGAFAFVYAGVLLRYDVTLALIGIALAGLVAFASAVLSFGVSRATIAEGRLAGKLIGMVVQFAQALPTLRVAGAGPGAFRKWVGTFARQSRLVGRVRRLQDVGAVVALTAPPLASAVLYYFVATRAAEQKSLTTGEFVAFLTLFGMVFEGMASLSRSLLEVIDNVMRCRLVRPILDEPPEGGGRRADPGRLAGAVHVKGVSFRYRDDGPLALDGVEIEAEPGEFVALVGPSGSGKSTLLRLLTGLEVPSAGVVAYDGRDLNGLELTRVRRQLGVVPQVPFVFQGTLYDNVACGRPMGEDVVREALTEAGLGDEWKLLPMGLYTVLADGGRNLSGGQRQRVLIARALAGRPRVVLFDEATSALDNLTQAIVYESLRRQSVTRIVAAHRLSTVRDAHRIYVLDAGRVVQSGTFEELASVDGMFGRLMQGQAREG